MEGEIEVVHWTSEDRLYARHKGRLGVLVLVIESTAEEPQIVGLIPDRVGSECIVEQSDQILCSSLGLLQICSQPSAIRKLDEKIVGSPLESDLFS